MIDNIYIDGFKCHSELSLSMSNLTLLVGTNASGKSSVIQALLLVVQNITNPLSSPLNGHLVSIGDFKEARNHYTNAKAIKIKVTADSKELHMNIREHKEFSDGKLSFPKKTAQITRLFNYSNNHFHYLSAHRFGNQSLHSKNYDRIDTFGIYGEYAIDYFETNKSKTLLKELQAYSKSETLESQVNYWLNRILGHTLHTEDILGTDIVKAMFTNLSLKAVRPKNTGSGISYIISIIILCLSSNVNDVIIIENPEIHLHPKAQSLLTDFFVFIANAGIQLIIETHSDHIFNGTRVQVYNKKIAMNKVACHFFKLDENNATSKHTHVKINKIGRVENHQKFLFDQFDFDINTLVGLYAYNNK